MRTVLSVAAGVALVVGALAFAAGYVVAVLRFAPLENDLRTLVEAKSIANEQFYYDKPTSQTQLDGAIAGLLASFNDPYTGYLPAVEAAQDNAVMQGETGGIGVFLSINPAQQFVVSEVRRGWPAEQAGIQAGDIILTVDGVSVAGKPLADIRTLIRGPLDTTVTLTLQRTGEPDRTVLVPRKQVNVFGEMLTGKIAYISFSIFSSDSASLIQTQLDQLLPQQPQALILDLRGNPGGYLDAATAVADLFLPEGRIVTEKLADGAIRRFDAKTGQAGERIPLVVLIDGNSASASEVVAGALRERGRAVLIGEHSYGKGSIQTQHRLSDGSQMRVTHGAWYTPNETPLTKDGQRIGLQPDVLVTLPPEGVPSAEEDPILQAAINYITKRGLTYF